MAERITQMTNALAIEVNAVLFKSKTEKKIILSPVMDSND
jgi:hypothetical protein